MDNYLAARWPAVRPAAPENKKSPERKKGRRTWRNILIVVLVVVLLAGLGVGSFFGVQYAAGRLAGIGGDGSGNQFDFPDDRYPIPSGYFGLDDDWTAALLPQADCDPSVQLSLLSRAGEDALSATEIYKKVLPSVVCVEAYDNVGYSIGSGIIISESGYIITNYHVVEGGTGLGVMLLSDRSYYDAALVGYDKELDLAILKAEGSGFVPAEMGDSDELETGDPVYAIGNPLGYLFGTMTDGIVSALSEDRVSELDYPGRLIQTTAALNSGNSGGALVDAYGRVVGITSAKITGILDGDNIVEGLGLAIPISDARPYLNRIMRTGLSARPSIGISCYSATVNGVTGILVAEVTKGTPAEKALRVDDLIIGANGVTVESVDDLTRIFSELDPGDAVKLTIVRGVNEITVSVELYDRLPETE